MKSTVIFLLLAAGLRAAPAWKGDPAMGARELETQWAKIETIRVGSAVAGPPRAPDSSGIDARGVLRFAVEAAGLRWHPERVEAALALARTLQDQNAASGSYGCFRLASGRTEDPDSMEFSVQLAAFLKVAAGTRLTPAARGQLDQILTAAVEAVRRHQVVLTATSVCLAQSWNLIACGESLRLPDVAQEGYRRFSDWVGFTVVNGISEYGAPEEYGPDLDSLALINKFSRKGGTVDMAETALNYFWTDLAANWWAPGDRPGGTSSRSADLLFGHGSLDLHAWAAGWLRRKPAPENAGWLAPPEGNLTFFLDACTWVPPDEVTGAIRRHIPRIVVQRWSYRPLESRAVNYVGREFSLASCGETRGPEERTLVANLGDSPDVPRLTLFMDDRGDPYGSKPIEGEAPPPQPFIATTQRGSEVLQVLSVKPAGPVLYTHLIVPARAEIWFGDRRMQPGPPAAPALLPAGQTAFIRLGHAVLAVKFLFTEQTDGRPAAVGFIADRPDSPARRLTVLHGSAVPGSRGTTAVWVKGAEGLDQDGFGSFRRQCVAARASARLHGSDLRVTAGRPSPLELDVDLVTRARHRVAGAENDALLSVNGEDVGLELLAPYGAK